MRRLPELFQRNEAWAARMAREDPEYFSRLTRQQAPRYLWIGCSDSRVPANQILDLPPGEVFVHRNVANLVHPTDFNFLAVLQYAVDVLRVGHVIVCGHYGCGGVRAALRDDRLGLADQWLAPLRELSRSLSEGAAGEEARWDALSEMNVRAQARRVAETVVVRDAWARGQSLSVHGWIYRITDGRLRDLGVCLTGPEAPQ